MLLGIWFIGLQGRMPDLEETITTQEENGKGPGRTINRRSVESSMEHRLHDRLVARWDALPDITVLDCYTRKGVTIEAGQSLKGEDVVCVLGFRGSRSLGNRRLPFACR